MVHLGAHCAGRLGPDAAATAGNEVYNVFSAFAVGDVVEIRDAQVEADDGVYEVTAVGTNGESITFGNATYKNQFTGANPDDTTITIIHKEHA